MDASLPPIPNGSTTRPSETAARSRPSNPRHAVPSVESVSFCRQHVGVSVASIAESAALLDHSRWEDELCSRVLIELAARPSPSPLRTQATQRRKNPAHERETAASASVFHIRPVGTQGLPEPTPSPRNSADVFIDAAASRCVRYRVALDQHIKDIKDKQDRHSYAFHVGRLQANAPQLVTRKIERSRAMAQNLGCLLPRARRCTPFASRLRCAEYFRPRVVPSC